MKKLIVAVITMSILLSAPMAMARGNNVRATLNKIWNKEQAQQQRIDKELNTISKDVKGAGTGASSFSGTPSAPKQSGNR
jgi:hypothetical protein